MPRVLLGEVDQFASRATVRHTNPGREQRLLQRVSVRDAERQQHLGAPLFGIEVASAEVRGEHICIRLGLEIARKAMLARQQFAAANLIKEHHPPLQHPAPR